MMKQIVHFIIDEKFTDFVITKFSSQTNVESLFLNVNVIRKGKEFTKSESLISLSLKELLQDKEMLQRIENSDILFFHSLNLIHCQLVLKFKKKKAVWLCWGGEIYNHHPRLVERNFNKKTKGYIKQVNPLFFVKNQLKLWFSKLGCYRGLFYYQLKAVPHVDFIAPVIEQDFELIREVYPLRAVTKHHAFCYGDSNTLLIKELQLRPMRNVLVGNSATLTNNHLDVFEVLRKANNYNKLIIPINYGDQAYANVVETEGRKIFGKKIEFIKSFLDKSAYQELLSTCEYFVLATRRQQAMGNVYAMLYYGAKIYVYKESPICSFLARNKLHFSTIEFLSEYRNFEPLSESEMTFNRRFISNHLDVSRIEKLVKDLTNV